MQSFSIDNASQNLQLIKQKRALNVYLK